MNIRYCFAVMVFVGGMAYGAKIEPPEGLSISRVVPVFHRYKFDEVIDLPSGAKKFVLKIDLGKGSRTYYVKRGRTVDGVKVVGYNRKYYASGGDVSELVLEKEDGTRMRLVKGRRSVDTIRAIQIDGVKKALMPGDEFEFEKVKYRLVSVAKKRAEATFERIEDKGQFKLVKPGAKKKTAAAPSAAPPVMVSMSVKLEKIKIPKVDFTNAKINELLDFIRSASKAFDTTGGQKGVNIVSFVKDSDVSPVTFQADNLSLKELLDLVTDVTDLRMEIRSNTIRVKKK